MTSDLADDQNVSAGEGRHRVNLRAVVSGQDVVVVVSGGEQPHVGAVAIAIPRKSLSDENKTSSTSSVFTLVGHKDDEVAKRISEKISKSLNRVVVVAAGLHIENADKKDIELLVLNSMLCCDKMIKILKGKAFSHFQHA